ncbi:transposase [Streptomyces sp. NPDC127079]|uniref:transposase n=1 Tax=Streptomyces sp. NPDC127079 TaxID=3347132 RepID=UPI00365DBC7F
MAKRILHHTEEINDLTARISTAIDACAPQLLDLYGVGPDTAAALLTAAGDNPDRLASEASFAALCGVSPVEASSGKTQRRRLNRGGDRQANSALYTIVIARLRWDTRTRSYVERRVTEDKTRREAIRCCRRTRERAQSRTDERAQFVRCWEPAPRSLLLDLLRRQRAGWSWFWTHIGGWSFAGIAVCTSPARSACRRSRRKLG